MAVIHARIFRGHVAARAVPAHKRCNHLLHNVAARRSLRSGLPSMCAVAVRQLDSRLQLASTLTQQERLRSGMSA